MLQIPSKADAASNSRPALEVSGDIMRPRIIDRMVLRSPLWIEGRNAAAIRSTESGSSPARQLSAIRSGRRTASSPPGMGYCLK